MGLVLKQLVPESVPTPPPDLPTLRVSIVDIMAGNVLNLGDLLSGTTQVGGVYTGVTSGSSFTATANGHTCTGVRFYRGDTHPVQVTLWQKGVGALATATGTGTGGVTTISFTSAVSLTPGALYCVTVFDTTAPTTNFSLAPTYWYASAGFSTWGKSVPQGVGNSSVLWDAGAMGVDFFNSPGTSTFQAYLCWYENSGNWGYGEPDVTSSNVLFPVEPVIT
jgi:hypothetical protein